MINDFMLDNVPDAATGTPYALAIGSYTVSSARTDTKNRDLVLAMKFDEA
ncbi:unnamed protein product, partial [marine sediment metagenome]